MMATIKTYDDLVLILHTIYDIECRHMDDTHPGHKRGQWCQASVCLLCGYVRFSCQSHWKDDCICDAREDGPRRSR